MEKGDDLMETSLADDSLTGVLDEIFDRAYSVTVTIGSDMLRGALFRFPPVGEDKKAVMIVNSLKNKRQWWMTESDVAEKKKIHNSEDDLMDTSLVNSVHLVLPIFPYRVLDT
ncbi:unnamed protein product [Microthlaspi erraticum]|uniref:Uncharacterized protein n=1 Tax=Microthlaspi erraticum TaxID=1685480 RepID=A0A6D2K8V9_9BRAS|nr:unnamed protein product [Microthlaspi erraticum]